MGEGKLLEGDVARLRKGLFEGKFAVSPGDDCLSVSGGRYTLAGRRRAVEAGERFKRPMSYVFSRNLKQEVVDNSVAPWQSSCDVVALSERLSGAREKHTCSLALH